MDRLISRTQRVCLAAALFSLLTMLPDSAQARSSGGAGAIAVTPEGLAFPEKVSGVSGERSWPKRLKISVSKQSGQPVTIKSISIGGADAADFAVHQAGNCVGATLTAGCAVTVTFKPTGLGPRTATLTVSDSSGANARTVALSGRGIKASIKWEPREISFGRVRPGATSTPQSISITNPNAASISIAAISLKSPDFTAFQTQSCVGPLAPHASCRFYVGANPPSSMTKSRTNSIKAKLQIKDNAAGSPHNVALSAVLNGTPLLPPPPPAPANLTHEILVTNTPCNNVTAYLIGAGGNAAPNFPQPLLCTPTGIAVDSNKNIYVTNSGDDGNPSYSVAVYPPGADGQIAPSSVIAGTATGLDVPHGVALDGAGNIYVANDGSNNGDLDSVTFYPAGSSGNAASTATISGAGTGLNLPAGVAIHAGNIYVANFGNNTVTVYPVGSNGNVAPTATIRGFSTGLLNPSGVALDTAGNIYVSNFGNDTVTVYPAGSNGNAVPSATLNDGFSPTGIALDGADNIYDTSAGNEVIIYPAGSMTGATPSAIISTNFSGIETDLDNPQAIAIDSGGAIYVANSGSSNGLSDTVTVYPAGSGRFVTASATISGGSTGLLAPFGIALDGAGKIYVTDEANVAVTVYPAGSNGNVAPSATISGASTGLQDPTGITLDSGGNIYVSDTINNSVMVYPAGSSGNVAPSATIIGDNTGLSFPVGIALDGSGNIYVKNIDFVTVYPAGSNGNVAPSATILGGSLNGSEGIALDGSGNLYVSNFDNDTVTVYPAGSNGNAVPSATISGASTGLSSPAGVALDSGGNIYVANGGNNTVTIYPAGSNGNVAPSATISGFFTGLNGPSGIALDGGGNTYVVNQTPSVTVYPAGTNNNGNQTPSAIINRDFALTNNGMNEPVGIALDGSTNIYVTNEVLDVVGSSFETIAVYQAGSGATGEPGTLIGSIFGNPATGVALDNSQNVYVVGPKPAEVDIFSPFDALSFLAALNGDVSLLSNPSDIAVDASGNTYVTNDATDIVGDRVTIYPAGSSGNTAPSAVIVGSNTGLAFPAGIAVDSTNIYVANKATDSVTVYPLAANGNVAPIATISGSNTGLNTPSGIALDSAGLIYVTNEGGYEGNNTSVTVYAAGANGNATPVTTVAGSSTQLARPRGVAVVPPMPAPTATATITIGNAFVP